MFEFNAREAYQFERFVKKVEKIDDEDTKSDNGLDIKSIIDKDFELFEPVMKMIEINLNVKIVLFYRK